MMNDKMEKDGMSLASPGTKVAPDVVSETGGGSWQALLGELEPAEREKAEVVRRDCLEFRRVGIQFGYRLGELVNLVLDRKGEHGRAVVKRLAGQLGIEPRRAYEAAQVVRAIPHEVVKDYGTLLARTGNDQALSWTHLVTLGTAAGVPEAPGERTPWVREHLDRIARDGTSVRDLKVEVRGNPDASPSDPATAPTPGSPVGSAGQEHGGGRSDGPSPASPPEQIWSDLERDLDQEEKAARKWNRAFEELVQQCSPEERARMGERCAGLLERCREVALLRVAVMEALLQDLQK